MFTGDQIFPIPPHTLETDHQDGLPSRASMAQAFLRFKFWEYSEEIFMAGWVHEHPSSFSGIIFNHWKS